ncbi:MAG TPA: c-type cytochrome [Usitatibacter sp.]|jgi:cytochrome c553|nr:c-type cytochrome [Usitatibacter sp.]
MKARRLAMGAVPFLFPFAVLAQGAAPAFAPPNLSPDGVRALAATCAPCHGPPGRPTGVAAVPGLAGRKDVAERLRMLRAAPPQALMAQLARALSDAEIDALARHFAAERPGSR